MLYNIDCRCIRKMDHHCPWVNNCVGENNQKYFVLFTVSIFKTICKYYMRYKSLQRIIKIVKTFLM